MNLFKKPVFHITLVLILITLLIVTVRIFTTPQGLDQHGYDYGFYAYTSTHLPESIWRYALGIDDDYGNHLFILADWLHLPAVSSMQILFIAFQVISALFVYLNLKKYSLLAAVSGVVLFAFSIAQAQAHTMFLWKNEYGQLLLLIAFFLTDLKLIRWTLIPLILILITHKTSSIIAFTSLGASFTFLQIKKAWPLLLILIGLAMAFLFGLNGYKYLKALSEADTRNGIFMTVKDYLTYSWYLIPLAAFGVYKSIKSKVELPWLAMLAFSLLIILAGGIFYQRMLFFADLGLIFFSAITLHYLNISQAKKVVLAGIVVIIAVVSFINFVKTTEPMISQDEISEIHNFSETHQGAFVLATSANDGPWLLGNLTGNVRLAAPGMFEDKSPFFAWQEFWINPKNQAFLNSYPQPLYIYERSSQSLPEDWPCLKQISANFHEYLCYKKPL